MKRLSDIRRGELRRAAYEVLQTQGLAGATLEKVAAHAGASKGIVLHYFANKQELFEQAMREANSDLRDAIIARLKRASSAKERLEAIINGNFDSRFFQPLTCQAWLSLCAELPREPTLARIQRAIHARMDSNLRTALRGLVRDDQIAPIAFAISTYIDGLWLRLGVAPASLSRDDALKQMKLFVKHLVGIDLDSE